MVSPILGAIVRRTVRAGGLPLSIAVLASCASTPAAQQTNADWLDRYSLKPSGTVRALLGLTLILVLVGSADTAERAAVAGSEAAWMAATKESLGKFGKFQWMPIDTSAR